MGFRHLETVLAGAVWGLSTALNCNLGYCDGRGNMENGRTSRSASLANVFEKHQIDVIARRFACQRPPPVGGHDKSAGHCRNTERKFADANNLLVGEPIEIHIELR